MNRRCPRAPTTIRSPATVQECASYPSALGARPRWVTDPSPRRRSSVATVRDRIRQVLVQGVRRPTAFTRRPTSRATAQLARRRGAARPVPALPSVPGHHTPERHQPDLDEGRDEAGAGLDGQPSLSATSGADLVEGPHPVARYRNDPWSPRARAPPNEPAPAPGRRASHRRRRAGRRGRCCAADAPGTRPSPPVPAGAPAMSLHRPPDPVGVRNVPGEPQHAR